jgi:hypothetical protein
MKNASNRYTLNIITENGDIITLIKGSLISIDEITSNFKDKQELINEFNRVFNKNLDIKKTRLEVNYNQNQHNKTTRILYLKDKEAMDRNKVIDMFLSHIPNIRFIETFVGRYKNNLYLLKLAQDVVTDIKKDKDYTDPLQRIVDLIFDSYKSTRDVYFFIKEYEKKLYNQDSYEKPANIKQDINGARKVKIIISAANYFVRMGT